MTIVWVEFDAADDIANSLYLFDYFTICPIDRTFSTMSMAHFFRWLR